MIARAQSGPVWQMLLAEAPPMRSNRFAGRQLIKINALPVDQHLVIIYVAVRVKLVYQYKRENCLSGARPYGKWEPVLLGTRYLEQGPPAEGDRSGRAFVPVGGQRGSGRGTAVMPYPSVVEPSFVDGSDGTEFSRRSRSDWSASAGIGHVNGERRPQLVPDPFRGTPIPAQHCLSHQLAPARWGCGFFRSKAREFDHE